MAFADHALVVGINRYPKIGELRGAHADACDFYHWVIDPAGGRVDPLDARLILSAPGASQEVKDAMPTRSQIEAFFTEMDEYANANNEAELGLKAGNRLYMFFSGHGFAPSLDRSAVLMANTTSTALDNLAARLWADRLFEGGWFDEILLFQDACRSSLSAGDLMVPFLRRRNRPGKIRFYAFSANEDKVSLEKPWGNNGDMRGVFTLTLMEGLRGGARDPDTGDITSGQLRAYLQANMKAKLSQAELEDDRVAKVPDVFDPNPCIIVPALAGIPASRFPVRITLPGANLIARVKDSRMETVATNEGSQNWLLRLPTGFYKLEVDGGGVQLFEVNGTLRRDGSEQEVYVRVN
jgi:uncharacterized caspase-like protein